MLLALDQECRRVSSKFILLLFPNTNNNTDYAREQSALQKFAEQHHIPILDLTESFLSASDPGELFLQYHFSRRGHELVADRLATSVVQTAAMQDADHK